MTLYNHVLNYSHNWLIFWGQKIIFSILNLLPFFTCMLILPLHPVSLSIHRKSLNSHPSFRFSSAAIWSLQISTAVSSLCHVWPSWDPVPVIQIGKLYTGRLIFGACCLKKDQNVSKNEYENLKWHVVSERFQFDMVQIRTWGLFWSQTRYFPFFHAATKLSHVNHWLTVATCSAVISTQKTWRDFSDKPTLQTEEKHCSNFCRIESGIILCITVICNIFITQRVL